MSSKHKTQVKPADTVSKPAQSAAKIPSPEQIQKETQARAHQIYLDRAASKMPGDAHSDWHQAEQEIKHKYHGK